ncbi:MAG TPA: SLBB domain-containing protein [Syntrophales bacterium]|nr:SLBB domain-containing protein [Syntrophales bacterium]HQK78736.1 SLBB domain-containing protein [Syntrophales bacterium]
MNIRRFFGIGIFILAIASIIGALPAVAQTPNITAQPLPGMMGQQMPTTVTADVCKNLPASQRAVCEAEIQRSGGRLTPEALQAIKERPAVTGTTPDEAARVRQLTEQKERQKITVEEYKEKTIFDRARNIGKYQDVSTDLKRFGADFFSEAEVSVTVDRKDVPVPMSYVIGPGDEIKLLLWGRVNAQYDLIVDRDGKITIPQIGPLHVSGLTFEQMSKLVIKQAEQIVGANIDISMGSPKMIPIFVIGDVKRPGSYTVGSFSTITDALLTAGGPTEIGSMRNVQLKRKGRLVTTFDLYDLLLKGDKSHDVALLAGDVIFVPITGPVAGIAGNVRRPALYELKHRYDLEYLLELAGGITPSAYTQQIQIERIVRNQRHIVMDIDDKKMAKAAEIALHDADLVKIFPIMDINVNVVYLNGNVKRPGKYEMKPGMRVGDLLKNSDDLLSETYLEYALIKRLEPPDMKTVLVPLNLENLLLKKDERANVELKPRDSIYVFHQGLFKDSPFVRIEGEIRGDCATDKEAETTGEMTRESLAGMRAMTSEPGGGMRTGMTVDTRTAAGGTAAAGAGSEESRYSQYLLSQSRAEKPRYSQYRLSQSLKAIEEDLKKQGLTDLAKQVWTIESEVADNLKIPPEDFRNLRTQLVKVGRPDLANQLLEIERKVKKGGALADVTAELVLIENILKRMNMYDQAATVRSIHDEIKNFGRVPTENMRVLRADLIRTNQADLANRLLEIENRTKLSCNIPFVENMRVKDVILISGGLTSNSYLDRAEIIRTNNKRQYQTLFFDLGKAMAGDPQHNLPLQNEDQIVVHSIWEQVYKKHVAIDGDVARPGTYQYTEGMTVRDLVFKGGNLLESAYLGEAEISSIVVVAGKSSATGRRVINLGRALAGDPQQNVVLMPNDRLLVKRIPNWGSLQYVKLSGEFKFPGKYSFHKGEKLSSVIERAGGYTDNAYLRGAVFKRETVRELQQKSLDEMARRMERELLSESSARVATSISAEEMAAKKQEAELKLKLIEYMKSLQATGRMTIALSHVRMLKGGAFDIELESGDNLFLPQKTSVVNVVGAVMSEGSHIYNDSLDYKDYVALAGGYARYADEANVFVIKVDGSARKLSSGFATWNDKRDRWEMTAYGKEIKQIEPGDVIVVPERIAQIAWLREIKDITQVLMNTAVTAATIIKLW